MAYYLDNVSTVNARIDITEISIGANIGDFIEFDLEANAGNAGDNYRIASGTRNTYVDLLQVGTTAVLLRTTGPNITFDDNYTQPSVGQRFILKLEKISSNQYECFLDGQSIGVRTSSSVLQIIQFGDFAVNANEAFKGKTYRITASTSGGSITNEWLPTASAPYTSTLLLDTVGNNNGTLVNFPADPYVYYVGADDIAESYAADYGLTMAPSSYIQIPKHARNETRVIFHINLLRAPSSTELFGSKTTNSDYRFWLRIEADGRVRYNRTHPSANGLNLYSVDTVGAGRQKIEFTYRFTTTSEYEIRVNDGTPVTGTDFGLFDSNWWDLFEALVLGAADYSSGVGGGSDDLQFLSVEMLNGAGDTIRFYDFNRSPSDAPNVPDLINGQDGTMVGFPEPTGYVEDESGEVVGYRFNGDNAAQSGSVTAPSTNQDFSIEATFIVNSFTSPLASNGSQGTIVSLSDLNGDDFISLAITTDQWGGESRRLKIGSNGLTPGEGTTPLVVGQEYTAKLNWNSSTSKFDIFLNGNTTAEYSVTPSNTSFITTLDNVSFAESQPSRDIFVGTIKSSTYIRNGTIVANYDFTTSDADQIIDTVGGNHATIVNTPTSGYLPVVDTQVFTVGTGKDYVTTNAFIEAHKNDSDVNFRCLMYSGASYLANMSTNRFVNNVPSVVFDFVERIDVPQNGSGIACVRNGNTKTIWRGLKSESLGKQVLSVPEGGDLLLEDCEIIARNALTVRELGVVTGKLTLTRSKIIQENNDNTFEGAGEIICIDSIIYNVNSSKASFLETLTLDCTNTISESFPTGVTGSNNISADATGDIQLTDLNTAFVDPANNDYRITQTYADANLTGAGIDGTDVVAWAWQSGGETRLTGVLTLGAGLTGTLHKTSITSGAISGQANASGAQAKISDIDGTIVALASVYGAINVSGSVEQLHVFNGVIGATAALSGTQRKSAHLSGALQGHATLAGPQQKVAHLISTLSARITLAGNLSFDELHLFDGALMLTASLGGEPAKHTMMPGALTARLDVQSSLQKQVPLHGVVPITAALLGVNSKHSQLLGQLSAHVATRGAMYNVGNFVDVFDYRIDGQWHECRFDGEMHEEIRIDGVVF